MVKFSDPDAVILPTKPAILKIGTHDAYRGTFTVKLTVIVLLSHGNGDDCCTLHFKAPAEPTTKVGVRMNIAAASAGVLSAGLLAVFHALKAVGVWPWFVILCNNVAGVKRSLRIETVGAFWPCALLVTVKVKTKGWFAVAVSPVRLNTNCPSFVQTPAEGSSPVVPARGKVEFDAVVEPVSPRSVIVGRPATVSEEDALHVPSSSKGVASSTVIVFGAHGQGVLWLAKAVDHVRGAILIGAQSSAPLVMMLVDAYGGA